MWRWGVVVMCAVGCGGSQRAASAEPDDDEAEFRARATAANASIVALPASAVPEPDATPKRSTLSFDHGTPVLAVDHWMWCFPTGASIDMCASTRELCAHYAKGGGCAPTDSAACFNTQAADAAKPSGWCFRTVESCRMGVQAWPGPEPVVLGCVVFRYDPTLDKTGRGGRDETPATKRPGWWCMTHINGLSGTCNEERSECEAYRAGQAAGDATATPCTHQRLAACTGMSEVGAPAGSSIEMCSPTTAMCLGRREFAIAHPDPKFAISYTECRDLE